MAATPFFNLMAFCLVTAVLGWNGQTPSPHVVRRNFLTTVTGIASLAAVDPKWQHPSPAFASEKVQKDGDFTIYHVVPDASKTLNPSLETVNESLFRKLLSSKRGGAVWLGEHHNSNQDHVIQTKLIRELHSDRIKKGRKVAVGLEQVQVQYQHVLDEFVAGKWSADELKDLVEWDKRWVWSFEIYRELFETAQQLRIPLIALNVNSEDLSFVEEGGLPALPRQTLASYVPDASGFASFASNSAFGTYVDYVIRPSYNLHLELGLLNKKMSGEQLDQQMSFRNFLSGRILWDETMANRAFAWTEANPGGLLVGLVGADHVKFGKGIPGRYARMVQGGDKCCVAILLNPTLVDSRPPGSVLGMQGANSASRPDRITLQLRYLKDGIDRTDPEKRVLPSSTGGVLPLADYLVVG